MHCCRCFDIDWLCYYCTFVCVVALLMLFRWCFGYVVALVVGMNCCVCVVLCWCVASLFLSHCFCCSHRSCCCVVVSFSLLYSPVLCFHWSVV